MLKTIEMADEESTSSASENKNGKQNNLDSQLHIENLPAEEGVTGVRTAKSEQLKEYSTDHHWTNHQQL